MRIRTKLFLITGILLLNVLVISMLFVWTIRETTALDATMDQGTRLVSDARNLHGVIKDLVFDLFSPQMYVLLKDLIHAPRFNSSIRNFESVSKEFRRSFSEFMASPNVRELLRDRQLNDEYTVALRMSGKAYEKIEALQSSLAQLQESGVLGGDDIYQQIQTTNDEKLLRFFDDVRSTSYYLSNGFESFLFHFQTSLQNQGQRLRRNILLVFLSSSVLLCLFAAALSLLFAGRISARIRQVEHVVRKISRGDFVADFDIPSNDEFGRLADNINLFIRDLKGNVDSVLKLMQDAGEAADGRFDSGKTFVRLVDLMANDMSADGAALFFIDDVTGTLELRASAGVLSAGSPGGTGILPFVRRAFETGEEIFLREFENSGIKESDAAERITSLIAAPLEFSRGRSRTAGVLVIATADAGKRLTDLDFTHLGTFADYASLAIENQRSYAELLEKGTAEYMALQSQIQPHFLYNILGGLIGLNRMGDRAALEKTIFALKDMLRYILEHSDRTTVAEEFAFLGKYCELQKIRFQERLETRLTVSPGAEAVEIPKLILQPLVENAVIHGIEPLERNGMVSVSAAFEGVNGSTALVLSVTDNGAGFSVSDNTQDKRVGLRNVEERLRLSFEGAVLELQSGIDRGTTAVIRIPLPKAVLI